MPILISNWLRLEPKGTEDSKKTLKLNLPSHIAQYGAQENRIRIQWEKV